MAGKLERMLKFNNYRHICVLYICSRSGFSPKPFSEEGHGLKCFRIIALESISLCYFPATFNIPLHVPSFWDPPPIAAHLEDPLLLI